MSNEQNMSKDESVSNCCQGRVRFIVEFALNSLSAINVQVIISLLLLLVPVIILGPEVRTS